MLLSYIHPADDNTSNRPKFRQHRKSIVQKEPRTVTLHLSASKTTSTIRSSNTPTCIDRWRTACCCAGSSRPPPEQQLEHHGGARLFFKTQECLYVLAKPNRYCPELLLMASINVPVHALPSSAVPCHCCTAGYARIVLTLGALAFAFSYPELCVGAYFLA
jgi:hypothetical protein